MGVILSLVSAVLESVTNVAVKKWVTNFDAIPIAWAWSLFPLIVLGPMTFYEGQPTLDSTFWWALSLRTVIDIVAVVLYVKAIQTSDLSLSLPLLSLTSVFLLGVDWIINGSVPTWTGIIGVFFVVIGVYLLNLRGQSLDDPLLPIKTMWSDPGSRLMLIVSLLWSFCASFHKLAMDHSNPYFYAGFGNLVLALVLAPVVFVKYKDSVVRFIEWPNLKILLIVGIIGGFSFLSMLVAQTFTITVYVITIKRLSIVLTALLAWWWLKESVGNRIMPIVLMTIGVFIISLT